MSGGQQQRLFARALNPPFSPLIEELALKLKEDYTIIMVTHNSRQPGITPPLPAGRGLEYDNSDVVLHSERQENRGLHYGEVWLVMGTQSF